MTKINVALSAFVVGLFGLVEGSYAAADTDVSSALTSGTTTLKDTVSDAIPLILGVAVLLVVLAFGKKLIKKAS